MEKLMTKNVLKKIGFVRLAIAACVGFPLFILTSNANAQADVAAQAKVAGGQDATATAERVVVTGSNIPTTETESALPVTVYSAEIIEKAGAQTPAEALRQLPSFVGNTATENNANGGDGTAAVSLRGLGPNNVLTLINGRRAFTFFDINAIPNSAISRIEILKDGASSVYGSDAVAGVVNFILLDGLSSEKPYEGAEVYGLYGNTTDTDAHVLQTYFRGGVTALDGKASIAASAEYFYRAELFSRDREIAALADRRSLGGNNQGSPAGFPGFAEFYGPGAPDTVFGANLNDYVLISPADNSPKPTQTGPPSYRFEVTDDSAFFNFRAYTPSIAGQEKASYYAAARYKIFDDALQVYGNILESKRKFRAAFAPAPFFLGLFAGNADGADPNVVHSPFSPFDTNLPGNPDDDQLTLLGYRTLELGNRATFYDYDYWLYTAGFNGDFNVKDNMFVSSWGYDAGLVYNRADERATYHGDGRFSVLNAAVLGQNVDGSPLMINGVQTFFDPFIGVGAPSSGDVQTFSQVGGKATPTAGTAHYDNVATAQLAAYVGHAIYIERDYLYDAKIFGNLFPGLYQGGVGVFLGYEHRNEANQTINDPTQRTGDTLGFNAGSDTKYLREVDSWFGEVKIPLVISSNNVPWVRSLEVAFAYRFEDFHSVDQFGTGVSDFDNGGTPRVSLRFQPIQDVVLRASYGQSFIAPAPSQLFNPPFQDFPNVVDTAAVNPTSGGAPFQPINGVYEGGNPTLKPEETDSYSAGIVYTPKFVQDWTGGSLSITADFYQTFTTSVILPAASFAQLMLTINGLDPTHTAFADPDGPGLGVFGTGGPGIGVTRNAAGKVVAIDSPTGNAGKRFVEGVDITAVYQLPTQNWGQYTWTLGYNYFFVWKAEPIAGAGFSNFLGDYNNGTLPLAPGAIPYHKGFLRGEWEWKGFDFLATGNYVSSFNDDSSTLRNPKAKIDGGTPTFPHYSRYRRVSDYVTLDLQLGYEFRKPVTEAVAMSYAKDAKDGKGGGAAQAAGADNGSLAQRMLWNTKITVGVDNAFDRNPPTVLGAFNDNYDTTLYTIRNRFWYTSLSKKF